VPTVDTKAGDAARDDDGAYVARDGDAAGATAPAPLVAAELCGDARPESEFYATLRIISTTLLTFACYFTIGMQLAVVPGFVHLTLHYGAILAGLAVSAQYAATLLSRPFAGRTSDTSGPKRATASGLCAIIGSGLLFALAGILQPNVALSIGAIFLSRFVLGFGESWVATGAALWGIARLGDGYEAKVISWNGIGSYGAVAIGAPVGVWLENHYGLGTVGIVSVLATAAALAWAAMIPPCAPPQKPPLAFGKVLKKVYADGLGLALGGIGFGTIAAFITLYYASHRWSDASLSLTLFGVAFVLARVFFSGLIDKWGGYRIAIVSLAIECAGLLILWLGATPLAAKIGATVSGLGFSLVFPALGVEAVRKVAAESRGSALAIYTAFVDLSLGISGPIAGAIVSAAGYPPIFLFAAAAAALGMALLLKLHLNSLSATASTKLPAT
jgi:MFS family permease